MRYVLGATFAVGVLAATPLTASPYSSDLPWTHVSCSSDGVPHFDVELNLTAAEGQANVMLSSPGQIHRSERRDIAAYVGQPWTVQGYVRYAVTMKDHTVVYADLPVMPDQPSGSGLLHIANNTQQMHCLGLVN